MSDNSKAKPAQRPLSELARGLAPDLPRASELTEEERVNAVWEHVGSDFKQGIRQVADKLSHKPDYVLGVLADAAAAEAGERDAPASERPWRWLKRHWPEFALATLAVLVSLLVFRAAGVPASASPAFKPRGSFVVRAASELAAFHVIRPEDVRREETAGHAEPGTVESPAKIVGRYTLQPLAAGAPLREAQLSGAALKPEELAGRRMVSLPVKAGTLSGAVAQAARVSLLLSPQAGAEKTETPLVLHDVIVLTADRQSNPQSVVVALPAETDVAELAARLGSSDVYLVRHGP